MITCVHSDIFKLKVDAIVNPVNCVGIMGKGLALEFKNRFYNNYKFYKEQCDSHNVILGKMCVYEVNNDDCIKYIINFPTKNHWRDKSELKSIIDGLYNLKHIIDSKHINSIAIPKIGCGLGGLSWHDVKHNIISLLEDSTCEILLCEP